MARGRPSGGALSIELRIPPPLVVLVAGVLMWLASLALPWPSSAPGQLFVAVLVAAAGIAVVVAGLLEFRRARTTVNPLKPETASSLVERGIYRFTRNPMYLGMALALAGWGIWLASAAALLVLPLFVAYMTRFQIIPEERALAATFGEAFDGYRRRVPRWL